MYCSYCGQKLADDAVYCFSCGRPAKGGAKAGGAFPEEAAPHAPSQSARRERTPGPKRRRVRLGRILGCALAAAALLLCAMVLLGDRGPARPSGSYYCAQNGATVRFYEDRMAYALPGLQKTCTIRTRWQVFKLENTFTYDLGGFSGTASYSKLHDSFRLDDGAGDYCKVDPAREQPELEEDEYISPWLGDGCAQLVFRVEEGGAVAVGAAFGAPDPAAVRDTLYFPARIGPYPLIRIQAWESGFEDLSASVRHIRFGSGCGAMVEDGALNGFSEAYWLMFEEGAAVSLGQGCFCGCPALSYISFGWESNVSVGSNCFSDGPESFVADFGQDTTTVFGDGCFYNPAGRDACLSFGDGSTAVFGENCIRRLPWGAVQGEDGGHGSITCTLGRDVRVYVPASCFGGYGAASGALTLPQDGSARVYFSGECDLSRAFEEAGAAADAPGLVIYGSFDPAQPAGEPAGEGPSPEPSAPSAAPEPEETAAPSPELMRLPDGDYRFLALDYPGMFLREGVWYVPATYALDGNVTMTQEQAAGLAPGDTLQEEGESVVIRDIAPVSYSMDSLGDWSHCPIFIQPNENCFQDNGVLSGWGINAFDYDGFTAYRYYVLYSEEEGAYCLMASDSVDGVTLRRARSSKAETTALLCFAPGVTVKIHNDLVPSGAASQDLGYSGGYYLLDIGGLRQYWMNQRSQESWCAGGEIISAVCKNGEIVSLTLDYAP